MLSSDWVRCGVHAVVGVALVTGHATLWMLILQSVIFGFAGGFFNPASGALVPQTVSVENLQQANALIGLSRSVTQVAGPALAGVIVAAAGPGWVFIIDSATFVVSAATLAFMRVAPIHGNTEHSGFWSELADGWRAVTTRRWYLLNLFAHAAWNFAIAMVFVLGPIQTIKHLGGASSWGLIGAAMGVGAIAGGLVALRVTPSRPLVAANLALVFGTLQLVSFAIPLPLAFVMLASALCFAGLTFLNELWFATVPQLMPQDVLARASSFDWLLSIVAMPAGFAVAGPVSDHIGITPTLLGAAAISAGASLFVLLIPGVRRVRRTDEGRIVLEPAI
jgi:predicted MFS family arabinose efflux permease